MVEVWRRARESFPDLQLVLAGAMADDDPEGWRIYEEIERETHEEPNCLLLTNQVGVGSHEVNALQRMADVVIQKSDHAGSPAPAADEIGEAPRGVARTNAAADWCS